jgi:hypothetical protein
MTDRRTFIKQLGALGILTMIPATLTTPKIAEIKLYPELFQDLNALHGINAEEEIAKIVSEEIGRTIDGDTLMEMWKNEKMIFDPTTFQPYKILKFEV